MLDPRRSYCLSRHVYMHVIDHELILESSLSNIQLKIANPALLRLLLAFVRPSCPNDVLAEIQERDRQAAETFLRMCGTHDLLTPACDDGMSEEETNHLAHWEFHDLLFHSRSRFGKTPFALGATFRFLGRHPPEPSRKVRNDLGAHIPLPRPDMEKLTASDLPFTRVLESRRSAYGLAPVTFAQLGEFLYRTCRITGKGPAMEPVDELLKKVYPSGGSLHPVEIYAACSACQGLEAGLYYYDGAAHDLTLVRKLDHEVRELFERARLSAGELFGDPPILFILTARFRRTAWKYQSIAYRAILMEIGGIYQTMYLVATAMRLAPCAIGCGDSVHFAKLTNSDYYLETSVGEFILGASEPNRQDPASR